MNDPDRPDPRDEPEGSDGPQHEGVRIIGAEEAAAAAGRSDVVRRRRGRKRFGDRPDDPQDVAGLPKIRISTSDVDASSSLPVGASEVVHPDPDEPSWSGDAPTGSGEDRTFGHARLLATPEVAGPGPDREEPTGIADPSAVEEGDTVDVDLVPATEGEALRPSWLEPEATTGAEQEPLGGFRPSWLDEPSEPGAIETATVPTAAVGEDEAVEGAGEMGRRDETAVGPDEDDRGAGHAPPDEEVHPVDERPDAAGDEPDRPGAGRSWAEADGVDDGVDEESFVLPHWTEPPTGQVPKVVAGEELAEELAEEPLASYGSQPRWRDEGDRTVETDLDDLLEDAPRLGALGAGGDEFDEDFDDEFFFDGESERDPLEAFAPEEDLELVGATRRRPAARRSGGPERPATRRAGPPAGGRGGDRNLVTAVAVGVALVGVGLLAFSLGGLATTILACIVVGFASFEYFGAVQRRGYRPATLLGLVAIIGLLVATYAGALAAYPVVLTLTVVLGLLWYLWVMPGEHSVQNLGITLLGVLWIGFLGSFATLSLGLGRIIQDRDDALTSNPGVGVVIAAVIAAVSHDVGAYFVGRYLGRTPLSSSSPNKTQEGLIGGVLTSLVVTMILVGFVGIAPIGPDKAQTFVFALLCALVSPLGDLAESFVKRDLDLKDMGSVLPGHGGVLDRFDALLFVLPTAYFVTVLFDVWGGVGA